LALLALVFGLVVAPILHRAGHGHDHHHPGTTPRSHGSGSLEHQQLSVQAPPVTPAPVVFAVAVASLTPPTPVEPFAMPHRATEQPQGP
jgi:hypothetical protein